MSNELQSIVDDIASERYASRGVTAFRNGGFVAIVKGGQVRATFVWIGVDAFVETWEYDAGDWRAEVRTRDEVAMCGSMCAESLAFE